MEGVLCTSRRSSMDGKKVDTPIASLYYWVGVGSCICMHDKVTKCHVRCRKMGDGTYQKRARGQPHQKRAARTSEAIPRPHHQPIMALYFSPIRSYLSRPVTRTHFTRHVQHTPHGNTRQPHTYRMTHDWGLSTIPPIWHDVGRSSLRPYKNALYFQTRTFLRPYCP